MISDLSLDFRLDSDMIAEVLEDIKNPKVGEEIKVRVPKFMDKESMDIKVTDEPVEQQSAFKPDSGMLLNASEHSVHFSDELVEVNYLIGSLENNSNLSKIFTIVRTENGHTISAWLKKTDDSGKPTKLRCTFKNGKLTELKLNSMDTIDDKAIEELV